MVLAEFAAVDAAEAAWYSRRLAEADHLNRCRSCGGNFHCEVHRTLLLEEIQAWQRYYDARIDAGIL